LFGFYLLAVQFDLTEVDKNLN